MKKDSIMITKIKCFIDYEKEIRYINEMNIKGWKLVYIKFATFYTFIKTKPDEYITLLHTTSKETISSLAALAAQCGYENIPHTLDGNGDFLYLTGKKKEVSDLFVSDNESKVNLYKRFIRKYCGFFILYTILSSFFLTPISITLNPIIQIIKHFDRVPVEDVSDIKLAFVFVAIMGIVGLFIVFFAIRVLILWLGYKKRYHALSKDMNIFE